LIRVHVVPPSLFDSDGPCFYRSDFGILTLSLAGQYSEKTCSNLVTIAQVAAWRHLHTCMTGLNSWLHSFNKVGEILYRK
jgi:hypothetical protein